MLNEHRKLLLREKKKIKSILFPVLSPELQESDRHIHSALRKGHRLYHESNKHYSNFTSQHNWDIFISRASVTVRQISPCGRNCCNSADFAGRLITLAKNLDQISDIFISWSSLTRSSCQLWWILGSFQHFQIDGFISMVFKLLPSM